MSCVFLTSFVVVVVVFSFLVWNNFLDVQKNSRDVVESTEFPQCSLPSLSLLFMSCVLTSGTFVKTQETDVGSKLLLKNRLCTFLVFSTHALFLCQDPKPGCHPAFRCYTVSNPCRFLPMSLVISSFFERTGQVSANFPRFWLVRCFLTVWLRLLLTSREHDVNMTDYSPVRLTFITQERVVPPGCPTGKLFSFPFHAWFIRSESLNQPMVKRREWSSTFWLLCC